MALCTALWRRGRRRDRQLSRMRVPSVKVARVHNDVQFRIKYVYRGSFQSPLWIIIAGRTPYYRACVRTRRHLFHFQYYYTIKIFLPVVFFFIFTRQTPPLAGRARFVAFQMSKYYFDFKYPSTTLRLNEAQSILRVKDNLGFMVILESVCVWKQYILIIFSRRFKHSLRYIHTTRVDFCINYTYTFSILY